MDTEVTGHQNALAPVEIPTTEERRAARLSCLSDYFLDIAENTGALHVDTQAYVKGGGSVRLCLNEIAALSPPDAAEQATTPLRTAYLDRLLHRPTFMRRNWAEECEELEAAYITSVMSKIERVIDAHTPEEALALKQMPTLIEKSSFGSDEAVTLDCFAGNHLYVLVDTALKEHTQRRELIESYRHRSAVARLLGNRAVRMTVAGGIFVASLTPKLGLLAAQGDVLSEDIDLGLKVVSASIFGLDMPDAMRSRYLIAKHDKRTEELHEELACDKNLCDLALRVAYSSTRYGDSEKSGHVTWRSGTADKAENLQRLRRLRTEYPHLNNDPGGKPYTGDQALGYAARLLIERKGEIQKIVDPKTPPDDKKIYFLNLSREIIVEDLARMKKGLGANRVHNYTRNIAGFIPAFFLRNYVSTINDAQSLGRDTLGVLGPAAEEDLG